jgi:hypothetical protein
MNFSLSTNPEKIKSAPLITNSTAQMPEQAPIFNEEFAKNAAILQATEQLQKAFGRKGNKGYGAINPVRGVQDPSSPLVHYGYDARGIREKMARITNPILREAAHKVGPIRAIQNTRIMQIRPFAQASYNPDDVGFTVKLKDKDAVPDRKDIKLAKEIQEFFLQCGKTDFKGYKSRKHKLFQAMPILTGEMMSIDQVTLSYRRDRLGRLLDFHILDGALIKPTVEGKGYDGDKSIKYVQEINGKVTETFREDDLLYYIHNERADLLTQGFGYSYIEQCIDIVTGWLFAMAYNKEVFNSSTMPKGFITFGEGKLDQGDLEELQRQWVTMFRGVKGMWRTPFLQHDAKWQNVAPSNRDMEWDKYTQVLGNWMCAIHGIDPAEMGVRLNQSQNVLSENPEAKIAYSKDRGLAELLSFHSRWMNLVKEEVEEWDRHEICFTGFEATDQLSELEVDEKQTKTYMTINEKRKEKDMAPLENGDIIDNQSFMQERAAAQAAQQQETMGEDDEDWGDEDYDDDEADVLESASEDDIEAAADKAFTKSKKFNDKMDYIEVEL